jgi:imidazolonepropionase
MWDLMLIDCHVATMDPALPAPFGSIENGAIGVADGRIVRVGRRSELAGYRASAWRRWAARG